MTVKELMEWLSKQPQDAEVWHKDMNFGGRDEPLEIGWSGIDFQGGDVLIASKHFEYLD